jgi:heat shock protein beta
LLGTVRSTKGTIIVPATNAIIVIVSSRLVTSPCAILANDLGYTANMERMISQSTQLREIVRRLIRSADAQNKKQDDIMLTLGKRQRVIELNPKSPLIEGMEHLIYSRTLD